ncbi:MAG: ABC transporter substrate-binding protein [Epsilonproteobacteria bacterium]|nr:ABC transporter substrate-binding protein [Campylobacterota bacterium]
MVKKILPSVILLLLCPIVIFISLRYGMERQDMIAVKAEQKKEEEKVKQKEAKEKKAKIEQEEERKGLVVDNSKEIVFGQSAAFSGFFGLYGTIIKNAINSCFAQVNKDGGINGKKLRLISMDDRSDPLLTEKNIKEMKEKHGITMFLGTMGTRGVLKVLPLIEQQKISMFFAWGGDPKLENPSLKNVINGFGLMGPQVKALADYCLNQLGLSQIAIFHSDGNFSTAAAQQLERELQSRGIQPLGIVPYNRFTLDIQPKADELVVLDPRVVICISSSSPTVKLINRFWEHGHFGTRFIGIDSNLFVNDILKGKGVQFSHTSTVPNPRLSELEIAKNYRKHLNLHAPHDTFNILSFAYYVCTSLIVHAIKNIDGDFSPAKLIEQIEASNNVDLGGISITFNPANRYAFGQEIWVI